MSERTVSIRFEGSQVDAKGVPLDDFVGVFQHLQLAVRRMVEYDAGRQPTRGRIAERIREAGALVLVGTQKGSLVAEIEVADPGEMIDWGSAALDKVLAALEQPYASLPYSVAHEVAAIPRSLHPGVETVTFTGGRGGHRVAIHRTTRFAPPKLPEGDTPRITRAGRILEVDWKDRTAELHTPSGVIMLNFGEEMGDLLYETARRHVQVIGLAALTRDGNLGPIVVEQIEASLDDSSFWSITAAELVRSQFVPPFEPPATPYVDDDDDLDQLLAQIMS